MKKFTKISLIIIGIIVLLIGAAALILPRVLDPNQHKERIIALVKEKTGRDLKLPGDISISVFPWLGAKVGKMELGNAEGFQASLFAGAQQIRIRVKLLPLLSRQVQADVVSIHGLTLNLERHKDGRTNWEDLIKPSPTTATETPESDRAPFAAALAVGGLDIQDAQIIWSDHLSEMNVTLDHFFVNTSAVNLIDPVTIKTGFDLDTGNMGIAGTVKTAGRVILNLSDQQYTITNLTLDANLKGTNLPGGYASIAAVGDLSFDAAAQKIDVNGFRLEASELTLGSYKAGAVVKTNGSGTLAEGKFDLKNLDATLTLAGGEERVVANLAGGIQADLKTKKIVVSDLAIGLPELAMKGIQGKLTAPAPGSAELDLMAGTLVVDKLGLSGTLSGDTIPGRSMPVEARVQLRADLNRQTIIMEPLQLDAAGISAKCVLTVNQFKATPQVKGTLMIRSFNPRDLFARLSLSPPETADPKAFTSVEISAAILAGTDNVTIDKLSVRLDDSLLTGSLSATRFESPDVRLDLALNKVTPERYLPAGSGEGAARRLTDISLKGNLAAEPGFKAFQVTHFTVTGKMDEKLPFGISAADTTLNFENQTFSAGRLELKAGEMTLQGNARATSLSTKPAYTADIRVEVFNARPLLSSLDLLPETADPKAVSAVSFSTRLDGSAETVSLSSLKLRLDDTRMDGKIDVTVSPALAYAFDIAVDGIDADRYLPPPKTEPGKEKEAGAIATPGAAATALPVDTLRGLNLDGKISLGKLKFSNLRLTDISVETRAKEGLLTLHPFSAGLYGGTYSGNILLDSRNQTLTVNLDEKLSEVRVGDLLNDLQGKALVTGITDAEIKLTGTGRDTDAILGTLNGNAAVRFSDGYIRGMDIAGRICRTLSAVSAGSLKTEDLVGSALQMLVKKATGTEKAEADRTAFSEMGGSMNFEKGVGSSKDLMLKSPLLRVEGAGSLDLSRRYLDYQATAALVKSCEGQGGKSFGDLKNYPIPVAITGPLDKLEVKPDLTAGILEILIRNQEKPSAPLAPGETTATPSPAPENRQPDPAPAKPVEKVVKDLLQDLLKKKQE